jgi:transposase
MRALDAEVVDAVWAAVESLLPRRAGGHPLGCHRPRVSDRLCFRGLLIRLVTGASWTDIETILEYRVSDTTLRALRDEWTEARVLDRFCSEAVGRSTASWALICPRWRWTGRSTRPPAAATELTDRL